MDRHAEFTRDHLRATDLLCDRGRGRYLVLGMNSVATLLIIAALFTQQHEEGPGVYAVTSIPLEQQVRITPNGLRELLLKEEHHLDLRKLWKALGISAGEFDSSCHYCTVTLRSMRTGEPKVVVARFSDELGQYSRFFVLENRAGAGWRLRGYIDLRQQFNAPDFQLIESSTHRYLAIDVEKDHGSGIGAGAKNWYEIAEKPLSQVLTYPSGAYQGIGWLLTFASERTLTSHPVSYADGDSEQVLNIQFTAKFADEKGLPLVEMQKDIVYVRKSGSEFRMDPNRSQMTQEDFETTFEPYKLTMRGFLKVYFDQLRAIAESRNSGKRLWLRRVLQDAPRSTPERSLLLEIIDRR